LSDADRIAALAERGVSLDLGSTDLCFLAYLHLRGMTGRLTAFSEAQLLDAFEQACRLAEPGAEHLRTRANHAIRRLREQRMLVRVDGAGVTRAGEFSLSRLAAGIVEFFLEEEVLTRESLTILSETLVDKLEELRAAAGKIQRADEWRTIEGPLRVTVSDLLAGIERRQRGLDLQQEEFQREIARLLASDWFGALAQCERLLETSAGTLRELAGVMLRDSHRLTAALLDLRELAVAHQASSTQVVLERLADDVDRLSAWAVARQRAWSEYYEYVHGYLRDVVRLDPSRALVQRLREQLAAHAGRPFALVVAAAAPYRQLRPVKPPERPPPVRRPRAEREHEPEAVEASVDPFEVLTARVRAELDRGVHDLSEITARLTEGVPESEHFLMAGRIAQVLAQLRRPVAERERPWVRIDAQLAIEQWQLSQEDEA